MSPLTGSSSDNDSPVDHPSRTDGEVCQSGLGAGPDTGSRVDQQANLDPVAASKLKRTACVLCRKRKLRCDAARPACATCARLGHDCEYDEQRKKSGPKRGYVKALETRLGVCEAL